MRVPILILALVATTVISDDAQGQWWNRKKQDQKGQQGQQGQHGQRDQRDQRGHHDDDGRPAPAPAGATISGTLYNDMDSSGSREGGEGGLSGWTISLTGAATKSAITDASGGYSFTGLAVGSYSVCVTGQSGWAATSRPRCWALEVTAAAPKAVLTGNDFGMVAVATGGGAV
jgi:hypothetical protein